MFIAIADKSQIASSRRSAESLARSLGFDETRTGRVAIIATEMMTNILKHATHGHLLVRRFTDGTSGGVEVMAMDKGPGIGDIAHAIEDAYSTVGTPGTGLGAIRRQADIFDIYSRPGAGTVLMARVLTEYSPLRHAVPEFELGVALAPYPGQPEFGDSWAFGIKSGAPSLFAVDGLGHGPPAVSAARGAVEAFEKSDQMDCVRVMETIHRALAPTRGAAIAVARVDRSAHLVRFSGIGNIAAALIAEGTTKRMVSLNGIAGHVAPRLRAFTYPYTGVATVVLHSDGVSARWEVDTRRKVSSTRHCVRNAQP
jgi:anti-sigma regulatory factor (Ser/Thr protein kinase)